MRVLIAFLLLASTVRGDSYTHNEWTPIIASELALASMSESIDRVPRSKCTVCKGSGKIKAGDGVTIVWRACDNCFDDSQAVEDDEEVENKRILFFSAQWCSPCTRVKRQVLPALESAGWVIGDGGQLQIIDVDAHPDLVKQYGIRPLPTFIMLINGEEVARHEGFANSTRIRKMWSGD